MTRAQLLQSNLDRNFPEYAPHKVYETTSPLVGFMKIKSGLWRFVDLTESNNISCIGREFRTRAELMGAMSEWLSGRGLGEEPDAEGGLNSLPRITMEEGLKSRTGLPTQN